MNYLLRGAEKDVMRKIRVLSVMHGVKVGEYVNSVLRGHVQEMEELEGMVLGPRGKGGKG